MTKQDGKKRRTSGAGSIIYRGKGKNRRAYLRIRYLDESTGKLREKYERVQSKVEANEVAYELRQELKTGGQKLFDGDRMTFRTVAEEYMKRHVTEAQYAGEWKVSGLRSWQDTRSKILVLVDYFDRQRIRAITYNDLLEFRTARLLAPVVITYKKAGKVMTRQRKEPRSLASVNRELEQLRAIFNFAHREGWIRLNPFQAGRALISKADEEVRERILSEEEETRLLAACVGPRAHLKAIIICALDTGMRRGEIFRLKWSDVDLQEGIISIRKKTTKTGKARVCGATPRLLEALELQWQMSDQQENSLVFGIANTIKRAWASACRVAEIAGLQFRDLRATANTRMEMANIPESIRMKILGHSQSSTNYRHYLRVNRDLAKSVATILGKATEGRNAQGGREGGQEPILVTDTKRGMP